MNREKWISYLVATKLFFVSLAIFAPFTHPHIVRQNDTLGIVVRYWLRWTREPILNFPLYPALIQAGDQYGIHATEFPIFYILMAPIFSLSNPWAIFMAKLFFLTLNLGLLFYSYQVWKKISFKDIDFQIVHLLLLIFGISGVYFSRFMPDFTAFMLVTIAVGLSFNKNQLLKSIIFASLGLLLKPTAILGFALIFLSKKQAIKKSILTWMSVSFIVMLSYYTFGTRTLNSVSDITPYFHSSFRNPFEQLINFLAGPKQIINLIFTDIFSTYILIFILISGLKNKKMWGILLLQILAGAALDGDHAFVHDYYFIGTSFTVALITAGYLKNVGKRQFQLVMMILLLFTLDKGIQANQKTFKHNILWQCADIKKQIPNELSIRTNLTRYADLGPCLQVKENSQTASFGVYYKNEVSSDDKELQVYETEDLVLLKF